MATYCLRARQLLVLFPLSHFDGRQAGDSGDQEIHQDVLAVGFMIHKGSQRLRQVVREQVVVVSVQMAYWIRIIDQYKIP